MIRTLAMLTVALVIVFAPVMGAAAQTETPTPAPNAFPLIQFPAIASPTPIATVPAQDLNAEINLPLDDIYAWLVEADTQLASIPADMRSGSGASLIPQEDGSMLFGYIKYLMSYSTADELFDPLAPLVQHISTILLIGALATGIAFALMLVVWIIRGVVWIVRLALEFIPG